eukprot:481080-Pleurochrysis_carterae.AAC.2
MRRRRQLVLHASQRCGVVPVAVESATPCRGRRRRQILSRIQSPQPFASRSALRKLVDDTEPTAHCVDPIGVREQLGAAPLDAEELKLRVRRQQLNVRRLVHLGRAFHQECLGDGLELLRSRLCVGPAEHLEHHPQIAAGRSVLVEPKPKQQLLARRIRDRQRRLANSEHRSLC